MKKISRKILKIKKKLMNVNYITGQLSFHIGKLAGTNLICMSPIAVSLK